MATFRFDRSKRLTEKAEFSRVFDQPPYKVSNRYLLILARDNSGESARLGLVVAKKHVRLATQRNRIKRLIRESFRLQSQLPGIDMVILVRGGIDRLDNTEIQLQLDKLWRQLQNKVSTSNRQSGNA